MSELLQLHLHSQLNTWLQWIGQRQLQYETRNIQILGFGVTHVKGLTVSDISLCILGSKHFNSFTDYFYIWQEHQAKSDPFKNVEFHTYLWSIFINMYTQYIISLTSIKYVNLCDTETKILLNNYANTMASDALALFLNKPSAALVLIKRHW